MNFLGPAWRVAAHLLIALIATNPAMASSSPDCSIRRESQISAAIEAALKQLPTLSGRILVSHCGKTILDRSIGFADRHRHLVVTPQTKFDIGSLTKQFVAAATLRLRDQGRLSLDDQISRFIPGLSSPVSDITVEQLLTHTSGLPMYSGQDYERVSEAAFRSWLRRVKLEHRPGEIFAYSNPGYSVLTLIVERLSGKTLEQYLNTEFFKPLQLTSTGYRQPKPPFAVNYFSDGRSNGTPLEKPWRAGGPYWNLYGNGGMLSTTSDLRRWFEALYGGRILSPAGTREMFAGHTPILTGPPGQRSGYGWRIVDDDHGHWINHGGSDGASFIADIRYFERSDALMVFSLNSFDRKQVQALVRAFADAAAPTHG